MGYIQELKKFHNYWSAESGGKSKDLIPITEETEADAHTHSLRAAAIINFIITDVLPIAYASESKKNLADFISLTPAISLDDAGSASRVLGHLNSASNELLKEGRKVTKVTDKMNERGYIGHQRTVRKLIGAIDSYINDETSTKEYDLASASRNSEGVPELRVTAPITFFGKTKVTETISVIEPLEGLIRCLVFKKDRLNALSKLRRLIHELESVERENLIIKGVLGRLGAFGFFVAVPPGITIYEEYMSTIDLCLNLLRDLAQDLPAGKAERAYDSIEAIASRASDWARLKAAGRDDLAEGYDKAIKADLMDAFELVISLSRRPEEAIDLIIDTFIA